MLFQLLTFMTSFQHETQSFHNYTVYTCILNNLSLTCVYHITTLPLKMKLFIELTSSSRSLDVLFGLAIAMHLLIYPYPQNPCLCLHHVPLLLPQGPLSMPALCIVNLNLGTLVHPCTRTFTPRSHVHAYAPQDYDINCWRFNSLESLLVRECSMLKHHSTQNLNLQFEPSYLPPACTNAPALETFIHAHAMHICPYSKYPHSNCERNCYLQPYHTSPLALIPLVGKIKTSRTLLVRPLCNILGQYSTQKLSETMIKTYSDIT